jgi:hypothetical protein
MQRFYALVHYVPSYHMAVACCIVIHTKLFMLIKDSSLLGNTFTVIDYLPEMILQLFIKKCHK